MGQVKGIQYVDPLAKKLESGHNYFFVTQCYKYYSNNKLRELSSAILPLMPTFDESLYSRIAVCNDLQSRVERSFGSRLWGGKSLQGYLNLIQLKYLFNNFFRFVKVIFKTEIPRYLDYLSETLFIVFENKLYGYTVLDEYSLISFHTIFAVESL